jgi:hypothetical protein
MSRSYRRGERRSMPAGADPVTALVLALAPR